MATINLTNGGSEPVVDTIQFSTITNDTSSLAFIKNGGKDTLLIATGYYEHERDQLHYILRKQDVPLFMRALQKAEELGWV